MKKNRQSIRLKGFDYSENGWYFVAICCQNRENLLGEIVGAHLPNNVVIPTRVEESLNLFQILAYARDPSTTLGMTGGSVKFKITLFYSHCDPPVGGVAICFCLGRERRSAFSTGVGLFRLGREQACLFPTTNLREGGNHEI